MTESLAAPPLTWGLSPVEKRIAQLISIGLANREIGERLFLAVPTVKNHTVHIYAKMGVENRVQCAVAWALRATPRCTCIPTPSVAATPTAPARLQ